MLCAGVVVLLGVIGFWVDFSNGFASDAPGTNTAYMFLLPIAFIGIVVWLVHKKAKQSHHRHRQRQEALIRRQVSREQLLGTTLPENITHLIDMHGPLSSRQLAELCQADEAVVLDELRTMLNAGLVRQHVEDGVGVYALCGLVQNTEPNQDRVS